MNEIGVQHNVVAKTRTSASEGQTGKVIEQGEQNNSPPVTKAEASQAERALAKAAENKQEQVKGDEESIERAVAKLNDYVQNTERKLEFQMDEDSGQTVVRVYDKNSEKLIRQIPNEEALSLAQKLNQEEPLMLFSAQV